MYPMPIIGDAAADRGRIRYTRWTRCPGTSVLRADILHGPTIHADPERGEVELNAADHDWLTPDEARLIGVRLIEAATLADGTRTIRHRHPTEPAAALDHLHDPGTPTRTPARGSHADKTTGAALALIAVLRAAPDRLTLDEAIIDPDIGMLTIAVPRHDHARQLSAVLGLPKARHVTELDDGWLLHRWTGEWADWPITVQHVYREEHSDRSDTRGVTGPPAGRDQSLTWSINRRISWAPSTSVLRAEREEEHSDQAAQL